MNAPKRIFYVQYTNPAAYPSLEHSARILGEEGWQSLFLGYGIANVERLSFSPHPNITLQQLAPSPGGWRQKIHYLRFCLWTLGAALRYRPGWIYASDPLSCPAGLLLSLVVRCPIIYHEHDVPHHPLSSLIRWVLWCRKRLARRAAICIAPNPKRLERLLQETGRDSKNAFAVLNCPLKEEVLPKTLEHPKQFRVLYHGSITSPRLPMTVLEALKLLPETIGLDVVGYIPSGALEYVDRFKTRAAELGLENRVRFVGSLPTREDLFRHAQSCSVGLALMPNISDDFNIHTMAGASNKAFDYLACGLPVLVSRQPDWTNLYVDSGYGLACDPDNPGTIAEQLRWFLNHPEDRQRMGELGRQRCLEEWNYDRQFLPVLERIKK